MVLAAAVFVALAAGGERKEIPAAAPTPTTQEPPPPGTAQPPQPEQPPVPPPAPEPPQPTPPAEASPTPTPAPNPPAPQTPAAPASLTAAGPNAPISLVAGGAPVNLPLTVQNTGGTMSEPVTAALNLPAGVSAIAVDGFAAPRLLSLNGAQADTVSCPGGTGTVTCSSGAGLAPGDSVTLMFRLVAAKGASGGRITGTVSAGMTVNVSVSVQVNVEPPPVTDDVTLTATTDWTGVLLWYHPVVEVTVTNSGTSSLPVQLQLDQPASKRWSSQDISCTTGGGTTCVTPAEVAPGEKLKVVFEIDADPWPEGSPNRREVHITATLGTATARTTVIIQNCWPTNPAPPTTPTPQPPAPPTSPEPETPPTSKPSTPPAETKPPVTTTTTPPSASNPPSGPGRSEEAPPAQSTPSQPPPSGGGGSGGGLLGGLLGWLLG